MALLTLSRGMSPVLISLKRALDPRQKHRAENVGATTRTLLIDIKAGQRQRRIVKEAEDDDLSAIGIGV